MAKVNPAADSGWTATRDSVTTDTAGRRQSEISPSTRRYASNHGRKVARRLAISCASSSDNSWRTNSSMRSTCKRLLIDTNVSVDLLPTSRQPPLNGLPHDAIGLVPRHVHPPRDRRSSRLLHPGDRQPLEQHREPAVWFGPEHFHDLHPMFGALGPRHRGMKQRAVLAGIQMPPRLGRLVFVQRTGRTAFRTRPSRVLVVQQMHVHLSRLQFKFHPFHRPGRLDAKNLLVQPTVLHAAGSRKRKPQHTRPLVPRKKHSISYCRTCPTRPQPSLKRSPQHSKTPSHPRNSLKTPFRTAKVSSNDHVQPAAD